ncbi:DNA topoisomerase IV subunit B [Spirochaeta africana]|uniref:DNA topoisomerase (ATP-hydrolyzing) n=1 Tax=Spirochaeta africana (strain ATCC 700263 / DSM 8902 / Z-7692) TaxID=889378 RepID=H9UKQ9_SPIAZ|nr:DNA topoisomerase IV subunit B [Spirochaeta africana]AFG38102.1 type IIA topoisomerase (DNA gyrase/topo II, topoisomerase IV), B subunit [Spirochaeta africana DSM 8902]
MAKQTTTAAKPAAPKARRAYDESAIKTLSSLEHIRLRPGMYIGRLGDGSNFNDGIYVLIKEVIDNSIDEFIMGHGSRIEIKIDTHTVSIADRGRGIPLGKVIECASVINTGGKYNDDVFQFSVGLNGVGIKAVNALSSRFVIRSCREGKFVEAEFSQGSLVDQRTGSTKSPNGTSVQFTPDTGIFGSYNYNIEFLEQRLRNYAYLNTGLTLRFNGQNISSENGLRDLLSEEVGDEPLYPILHHRGERLEFAFTHTETYGESHFSFVNGQYTNDGGTHLSAFREGVLKGVNEFYKKNFSGVDVREGIAGAVAVRLKDPIFESQTKNKLGNTDIRAWIVQEVREAVIDLLHKNKAAAETIERKVTHNERLRRELNTVKKQAKEKAKKIALKIPNLKDCKYHRGDRKENEQSTIFLTEGQSASGSMVSSRDPYTQAIFSLRGKPQNMFGRKRTEIYTNEELYNLMQALGIEDDLEGLRFSRIVIATDADHDGFHIRNLLLTYFFSFFEELILDGRVFILETPLFRVRNKKETRYCYNDTERDDAVKTISSPEVTRFKGLGEISPSEFGQFIGPDIRLVEVNIKSLSSVHHDIEFYMGKNTPTRRDFIMENLV